MYYGWSNEFLEAVKGRLAGDTARAATSDEVKDLRREAQALKKVVADLTRENRLLKKRMARAICKGFDLAGGVGGFDDSRSASFVSHAALSPRPESAVYSAKRAPWALLRDVFMANAADRTAKLSLARRRH
jgi:hypothetical protein